jgi:hypothetical protein
MTPAARTPSRVTREVNLLLLLVPEIAQFKLPSAAISPEVAGLREMAGHEVLESRGLVPDRAVIPQIDLALASRALAVLTHGVRLVNHATATALAE